MKDRPSDLAVASLAATVALSLLLTNPTRADDRSHEPDRPIVPDRVIQLFNGRSLDGWTTWLEDTRRDDPRMVYSVRDGAIRISGDGFGYLSTAAAYKDYRLVVETKWGVQNFRSRVDLGRDSGIFLHSVGPDGNSYDCSWGSGRHNTGPDISSGAYKAAIECQVMEGGFGDIIVIGGRYANGDNISVRVAAPAVKRTVTGDYATFQFNPAAERLSLTRVAIAWSGKDPAWRDVLGFRGREDVESPLGEWTRIECECAGDRIAISINGKLVNAVHSVFPAAGKILLQCEGSEVYFRKVELQPLKAR